MKIRYERFTEVEKDGKIVRYPNPQFNVINKIFIKSTLGIGKPTLTQYYGDNEEIINLEDFNEYGWEFLADKVKYNSKFPLDYLINSRKEEIGSDLVDISTVAKTFFPTVVKEANWGEGETIDDVTYFGTITVGHQKLLMVKIPPGYNYVELWDTSDITIERTIKKNINGEIKISTIWTGPYTEKELGESSGTDNDLSGYLPSTVYSDSRQNWPNKIPSEEELNSPFDSFNNEINYVYSVPKILITLDNGPESEYGKIVWFVVSTGRGNKLNVEDINLAFISWESSINPHRKMNQYLLRRDEKVNFDSSISVVNNLEHPSLWMDMSSGTILGNRDLRDKVEFPIFNEIMEGEKNNRKWNKRLSYSQGNEATYNGSTYVSLLNNNLNNIPILSPTAWMLKTRILGMGTLSLRATPCSEKYKNSNTYYYESPEYADIFPKKFSIPTSMPRTENTKQTFYISLKTGKLIAVSAAKFSGPERVDEVDLNGGNFDSISSLDFDFGEDVDEDEAMYEAAKTGSMLPVYVSLRNYDQESDYLYFYFRQLGFRVHYKAFLEEDILIHDSQNSALLTWGSEMNRTIALSIIENASHYEVTEIKKIYKVGGEEKDIEYITENLPKLRTSQVNNNSIVVDIPVSISLPAEIYYEVNVQRKTYTISVTEHYNIYVLPESQKVHTAAIIHDDQDNIETRITPAKVIFYPVESWIKENRDVFNSIIDGSNPITDIFEIKGQFYKNGEWGEWEDINYNNDEAQSKGFGWWDDDFSSSLIDTTPTDVWGDLESEVDESWTVEFNEENGYFELEIPYVIYDVNLQILLKEQNED